MITCNERWRDEREFPPSPGGKQNISVFIFECYTVLHIKRACLTTVISTFFIFLFISLIVPSSLFVASMVNIYAVALHVLHLQQSHSRSGTRPSLELLLFTLLIRLRYCSVIVVVSFNLFRRSPVLTLFLLQRQSQTLSYILRLQRRSYTVATESSAHCVLVVASHNQS